MLGFLTKDVMCPWTVADIDLYEKEGSQRDNVIYNRHLNARIHLTDKNLYLCSVKQKSGKYINFYILGATRSVFYFLMYVPELETYRGVKNDDDFIKWFNQLPLSKISVSSFDTGRDYSEGIRVIDGSSFMIRVDAGVGEFLFPRTGKILNSEIDAKYKEMISIYKQAVAEHTAIVKAVERYNAKITAYNQKVEENREKTKKKLVKIAVRKGIRYGVPALLGIPPIGLLGDLDTLFDLGDAFDVAELASGIDIFDVLDLSDITGAPVISDVTTIDLA